MMNDAPWAGWVSTRSLTRAAVVKDSRPARAGTPSGHAGIGHQIQHSVAPVAGAASRHDLSEAAQTALGVLLGQAGNLGVESRLCLALDEIRARPIHKQQNA
jgi:hypothetical protein